MARDTENECAWCANELRPEPRIIGRDWKVYCSRPCADAGELLAAREDSRRRRQTADRHARADTDGRGAV